MATIESLLKWQNDRTEAVRKAKSASILLKSDQIPFDRIMDVVWTMEIDPIKVLDLVEEGWQLLHIDTGDELDEMNPGPILYFAKLQEA
ncbi:hypothetical protein KC906_03915 [Candidatus Kaiserbacteria bacterium]|nr:hypothetical protein [Candidatus Kaiserbacteria bacterium]MCB9812379.1 hypothetical protein [Candidatus Nomurabacteria bacterium]